MGKRIPCLALSALLALCLTGCCRDEEAARTPDIDFYIQYASERFGVPEEDISVVQFQKGTSMQGGLFASHTVLLKPVIHLEWNGKVVSFSYTSTSDYYDTSKLRDDYYFDELYESVREYCARNLGLNDVILAAASGDSGRSSSSLEADLYYGYNTYLGNHDISEVNDSVIEDFISQLGEASVLYVELKEENLEAEVKALIDRLKQINFKAEVQVTKNLSDIIAFRRPINENFKYNDTRPLCVNEKDFDFDEWLCVIVSDADEKSTEYQGYSYAIVDHSGQEEDQDSLEAADNAESGRE